MTATCSYSCRNIPDRILRPHSSDICPVQIWREDSFVFLRHLLGHLFALQQAGSLHSQHSFIQSCAEAVGEGHQDCALLLHLDRVASFNLQSSHNYKSTQEKKWSVKLIVAGTTVFNPIKKGKKIWIFLKKCGKFSYEFEVEACVL